MVGHTCGIPAALVDVSVSYALNTQAGKVQARMVSGYMILPLAGSYLRASRLMAEQAELIEDDLGALLEREEIDANDIRDYQQFITAYSVAAITTAFTSMEAVVGELCFYAADVPHILIHRPVNADGQVLDHQRLDKEAVGRFGMVWKRNKNLMNGITAGLNQANLVLQILGCPEIDRGGVMAADAEKLRKLRNILIHYKPSLVPTDEDSTDALQRGLSDRFPPSPLKSEVFPDSMLCADGAAWAAAADQFIREFFQCLGINSFLGFERWASDETGATGILVS